MTFSEARRPAALIALLIAIGGASAARAADDDTPVSVLIGDAVAEYDAGHFQEARALFRQAHEKSPTARTLRGIGMCSFELRDYVEAARALGASLRETRRPLTAEQKRHAEALLGRANTFVGRFTVKVKPESASLFVDGHPAELEPDGVLLLPFGRHTLSLRCASCAPAEKDQDIDVSGGEHKDRRAGARACAPPPHGRHVGRGRCRRRRVGRNGRLAARRRARRDRRTEPRAPLAHRRRGGRRAGRGRQRAVVARPAAPAGHLPRYNAPAMQVCGNEIAISARGGTSPIGLTIGLGAAAVISGVAAALLWPHGNNETPAAVACLPTNNCNLLCVPFLR